MKINMNASMIERASSKTHNNNKKKKKRFTYYVGAVWVQWNWRVQHAFDYFIEFLLIDGSLKHLHMCLV